MEVLMKKALMSACAVTALLFTAGCSSSSSSPNESTPSDVASAEFNADDVMFAQMMIPHHEQAVEMSDIALDPTIGAGEEVLALAREIKDAQDPEITQMTDLLTSWGQPISMDSSMDHSSMMSGMLSYEELQNLGTLRGTTFDTAWLEAMIKHHEGAIQMANDVLRDGINAEVRALAQEIIAAQQTEIDLMRALLS
jgi:uncharacterized protein (DUF305 family)